MIARLLKDDDGQDLIEYAILTMLVAIALIQLVPGLADKVGNAFVSFANAPYDLWTPNDPL